jgi:predicted phage-related endonuclease
VHLVNVQVQLSIYAWLYELQNPGKKVGKLWLIWLPKEQYGMPELREIPRIPADVCEYVVEVYGNGGDPLDAMSALVKHLAYEPERKRVEGEVPEGYQSVIDELIMVKKQLDVLSEREKELRAMLLSGMQGVNEDKWSNDLIQISRRAASERESVDAKALKAKMPDVYESFKKVTKVAESLTYKVL